MTNKLPILLALFGVLLLGSGLLRLWTAVSEQPTQSLSDLLWLTASAIGFFGGLVWLLWLIVERRR